jgi:hypothetical protein
MISEKIDAIKKVIHARVENYKKIFIEKGASKEQIHCLACGYINGYQSALVDVLKREEFKSEAIFLMDEYFKELIDDLDNL